MIGDNIILEKEQLDYCEKIVQHIRNNPGGNNFCISIAGESGCGKSTLAIGIQQILETKYNEKVLVLHMDDYFHLPPADNHQARVNDIGHIGPSEVDLARIDTHIKQIESGVDSIRKPLVDFHRNQISQVALDTTKIDRVIVEGTYVSLLEEVHYKIFIDRDYHQTYQDRIKRAREAITPFIEQVLAIEHGIISSHKAFADCIINAAFEIEHA